MLSSSNRRNKQVKLLLLLLVLSLPLLLLMHHVEHTQSRTDKQVKPAGARLSQLNWLILPGQRTAAAAAPRSAVWRGGEKKNRRCRRQKIGFSLSFLPLVAPSCQAKGKKRRGGLKCVCVLHVGRQELAMRSDQAAAAQLQL